MDSQISTRLQRVLIMVILGRLSTEFKVQQKDYCLELKRERLSLYHLYHYALHTHLQLHEFLIQFGFVNLMLSV